jgi:transposase-like protein DUF772
MLLAVLLHGYCTGVRSSRQLKRRCHEDVAFRILSANTAPDHVTFARFRVRHEQALAWLLVASLRLCAAVGMVRLGLICLDGTKIEANAAAAGQPGRRADRRPAPSSRPRRTAPLQARHRTSGYPSTVIATPRWSLTMPRVVPNRLALRSEESQR